MKSKRRKMPIEQYLQMQHPFGYKVEYYDGEAVFQPQETYIDGRLILTPQTIQPRHSYETVEITHQQAIKDAFFMVFQGTVEFCDWPIHAIRKHAEKNVNDYFSGARGEPCSVSKLLLNQASEVIALALFITKKSGKTKLDLLLVLPEFQRQGIATEIVALACQELQQQGLSEIYSSWHALNEASQNWHHRFGFTDVYDQYFIQRKHRWYQREIQRLESQGIAKGIAELRKQKDHWYNLLDAEWQSITRN